MAGNVKEWCWNRSGSQRYILGGAWNEPNYMYYEPDVRSPLDRSAVNGFRTAQYSDEDLETLAQLKEPLELPTGARAEEEPVSDAVFEAYNSHYTYDPSPLEDVIESSDESSQYWRKEKVSFGAAYGDERVTAFLFLPRNIDPPYQTVV
jgi:hypothetical protein